MVCLTSQPDIVSLRYSSEPENMLGGTFSVTSGRRSYSPEMGRWVSRDPAEEDGGLGLYAFLDNSPLGNSDFLGLWSGVSRSKDMRYGTCCAEKGDSVETLVDLLAADEGVHLSEGEALGANGWLRNSKGNPVTEVKAGQSYRFPNTVHVTYGNLTASPMAIFSGTLKDMKKIGKYLKKRDFHIVDHRAGIGIYGNSLANINSWLADEYVAGWAHGGHGHGWTVATAGGGLAYKSRCALVIGKVPPLPAGPSSLTHTHTSFKPHHKLSVIILNSCYAAQKHKTNWFRLLSSGGTFRGSYFAVSPGGALSPGWKSELKEYVKP